MQVARLMPDDQSPSDLNGCCWWYQQYASHDPKLEKLGPQTTESPKTAW